MQNGVTALMVAADKGDGNIVRALLAAGSDVNAKDEVRIYVLLCIDDMTYLYFVCRMG